MQETMRALVARGPNDFGIEMMAIPKPKRDEVLCRVRSVAICGSDPGLFSGKYLDLNWPPSYPFVFGHEWSGEVVALGEGAAGFSVGDRVAGEAHCGCGHCENCKKGKYTLCMNYGNEAQGHRHYGFTTMGAYAEYGVFNVRSLEKMPERVSFDEATMCDTGGVALQGIRLAEVTSSQFVAIYGPGPIGNLAMQIAKVRGAKTIMVGRRDRLALASSCGADYIVDYEKKNPVEEIMSITEGVGADAVIEAAGNRTVDGMYNAVMSARKDGKVALLSLPKQNDLLLPAMTIVQKQIHVIGSRANPNTSKEILQLLDAGSIDTGMLITHTYDLADMHEALDLFTSKRDGVMKVVMHP